METLPLEVYSDATNSAVIKPPGRENPGVVIQGDTLFNLCDVAKQIAIRVRDQKTDHEDFPYDVERVLHELLGHLLHYQKVLQKHNHPLPYSRVIDESDFIRITPDSQWI
jgi:hypothetical protein